MLENVETLMVLHQHQTMIKAASVLRLTQSAVSKRVHHLEDILGQQIIVRQGRRVQLTAYGLELITKLNPLITEVRSVLHQSQKSLTYQLTCGVSESLLASFAANLLAQNQKHLPELAIDLHAHRSPVVIDRVQAGEYSLGICAGYCSTSDLEVATIGYEPMVVIMGNPRNKKQLMTIETASETWKSIENQIKQTSYQITQRLESFACIAQLAHQGWCNGLVPLGLAHSLRVNKRLFVKPSKQPIRRPIIIVGRKTTLTRPMIKQWIEQLSMNFKKLGLWD